MKPELYKPLLGLLFVALFAIFMGVGFFYIGKRDSINDRITKIEKTLKDPSLDIQSKANLVSEKEKLAIENKKNENGSKTIWGSVPLVILGIGVAIGSKMRE